MLDAPLTLDGELSNEEILIPMRSITQKELARHLGLSQATVSRALSNDHQITRETRERVREAAEKLGYRPSVALASFHSKEHWTNRELRGAPIAVLFHTGREASGMGGHDSLERQAGERGFRLQWMDVGDPKLRRGLGQRLFNQGFQGVLFAPIRGIPDDWMAELDTSRFALAAIDRRMAEFGITAFHGAVRRTVTETLNMMRERGYTRIGAALWNLKDHPDHMNRIGAFQIGRAHV
jgi:LacI family transcriptional regulator